uniref:Uncharacterized protein n=2 Tax=Eutreptiella gymnastica TaxID=73025 RepID=A0A7S1JEU2_9EUGL|mmetsp:Transcript_91889/g.159408  ORF Transcript_91889/g.159408 Transcript_91889/m.159408 type:complete len:583 (+) Transcript_91889:43-1791(+)
MQPLDANRHGGESISPSDVPQLDIQRVHLPSLHSPQRIQSPPRFQSPNMSRHGLSPRLQLGSPLRARTPVKHTIANMNKRTSPATQSPVGTPRVHGQASSTTPRGTIRFDDLGQPMQEWIVMLKQESAITDEELGVFLQYVSVREMAKIFEEMGQGVDAVEIWDKLYGQVEARAEAEAEARAKVEAKAQAIAEAEAQAIAEAEARAKAEAQAQAVAEEAEARAKVEAEALAKAEAEAQALAEAAARAIAEAEDRASVEADVQAKSQVDTMAQEEASSRAKAEGELRATDDAQTKSMIEAQGRPMVAIEVNAMAEVEASETEAQAASEAQAQAIVEAQAAAPAEVEAMVQAEAQAVSEADVKCVAQADAQALAQADAWAQEALAKAKATVQAKVGGVESANVVVPGTGEDGVDRLGPSVVGATRGAIAANANSKGMPNMDSIRVEVDTDEDDSAKVDIKSETRTKVEAKDEDNSGIEEDDVRMTSSKFGHSVFARELDPTLRTKAYDKLDVECHKLQKELQGHQAGGMASDKQLQKKFRSYVQKQKKLQEKEEQIIKKAIKKAKPGQQTKFWHFRALGDRSDG